ncbi:MAG: 1-acyl-sn-glycerol-3-phosphate acyltransferase [Clostridia bacterium]|nr:1-acyl-sn-glycerol-3-phosphate acyltransferase [Clostridia bacterium]
MKTTVKVKSYDEAISKIQKNHKKPIKPLFVMQTLIRVLSFFTLLPLGFKYTKKGMEKVSKNEPCLYLMNHSAFVDLQIASTILWPKKYSIIMTSDGFVGKNLLMKTIGCIPTQKFVSDSVLVRDIFHCIKKNKTSVLLYPEASYSFDGRATTLPESLGKLVKKLGVPVVMITTTGAFMHQPLYNNLKKRKVKISAEIECLLTADQTDKLSFEEINRIIGEKFNFDNFKWQQENKIKISEKYRADYLHRVLYKCPHCGVEGETVGKGTTLTCNACGKVWELTEYGFMKAQNGETEFPHVPDWYDYERQSVKKELLDGSYNLDCDVDIYMLTDMKAIYNVGSGRLIHNNKGFRLTGCDGKIDYTQVPELSYSLYSDYYWYEIGDMVCIGNGKVLYYCFPKDKSISVAKVRLAAEELYKIVTGK